MARLLLIDDSELVLDMLSMALGDHELTKAVSFTVATEIVSRETFDLIVTDLNLPDLDGDPVSRLRAEGADAPILIMSGISVEELSRRAVELGAAGSLSKDLGLPGMSAELLAFLDGL